MADQALLCAKRAGRDRVVRYSTTVDGADPKLHGLTHQDGIFEGIVARDVMTGLGLCLRQEQTIDEAAQFLTESHLSSTLVLDANDALAGFLSEKDLMAAIASPDRWQRPVHTVMRRHIISYEEDTPIRLIYEFLCRVSIRGVVITRNGCPTGTISRTSLLQWFHNRIEKHSSAGDELLSLMS